MRGWRFILVVLLAGSGLAYFVLFRGASPSNGPVPARANPGIPVFASKVERMDVPIVLNGLGNVQAYNSVLVRSRVDGQIMRINFSEGKDVRAGDVLLEIDPAPFAAALEQAQANKLRDEAQLDNARLDLNRNTQLVAKGAISTQQLDTQRALVAQLNASVKADQAMIDSAQVQLDYSKIRAPIDGRAGTRLVDAGNIVHATDNTGIVTINQIQPIFVDFSLPADSLAQIRAKSKEGDLEVTAQDSGGRNLAAGKLTVIDNKINPATGTINYKATFGNADEALWPGQFVNVRVQIEIRRDVIAVPVTAVQYGPDGPYSFVISPDRVAHKRALKVGVVSSASAIIDEGLARGDVVVTDGQYRIEEGSVVEVLDTPQSPADRTVGALP